MRACYFATVLNCQVNPFTFREANEETNTVKGRDNVLKSLYCTIYLHLASRAVDDIQE